MGAAQSYRKPSARSCPKPVYDSTTCKEFVGTGCPQPVYDSTTCASVIKTALDAKKCAPIFGIQYNDSNENVKNVMVSFQNLINKLQEILCSSQLKYLAFDMLNEINSSNTTSEYPKKLRDDIQKNIDEITYETKDKEYGISIEQFNELKKLILVLINVLITVNTDSDGTVNSSKIKQTSYEILNSLCLDYKAPERTIANQTTSVNYTTPDSQQLDISQLTPSDLYIINKVGAKYVNTEFLDLDSLRIEFVQDLIDQSLVSGPTKQQVSNIEAPTDHPQVVSNIKALVYEYITQDVYDGLNENQNGIVFSLLPGSKKLTVTTPAKGVVNPVKSTFGAMADYSIFNFGSTTSTFLIILIILLIVGGVLYFLHKKGKNKIPGLPQRIAEFGRQIKAIRKM